MNSSNAESAGTRFDQFPLAPSLHEAVRAAGYEQPTPIQEAAIPLVLHGRDVLGCAQTGTGKTAAFALPILTHLLRDDGRGRGKQRRNGRAGLRALVLAPTRELAAQIGDNFGAYAKGSELRHLVVFGGVGKEPQVRALRRGVDVLIATPGRLLDLMSVGAVSLRNVEHVVLDEADRMLDMGFIHDIKRVMADVPDRRQTLLFSATIPPEIEKLAAQFLYKPQRVAVDPVSSTCEPIEQSVYFVEQPRKTDLLVEILRGRGIDRAIIFTRTKHGANRLARKLTKRDIPADAIHGDKSQGARERTLAGLRSGEVRVVVATDLASRGLDVKGLSHVVNFDLPNEPESYVHRIGRTGRAGESGIAVSLCSETERPYLRDIEKLTKRSLVRRSAAELGLDLDAGVAGEPPAPAKPAPTNPAPSTPSTRARRVGRRARGAGRGAGAATPEARRHRARKRPKAKQPLPS